MNMSFLKQIESIKVVVRLCACAAVLLVLNANAAGKTLRPGDQFPNLTEFGLDGTLPDLKEKVVLVDFWASWCAPCKKSFPVMAELQQKFQNRGFVILAVGLDEKKSAMDAFLKKNPLGLQTVHDPKGKLAETVGVEVMPTSFLVGADGKVIAVHRGFEGESTRKAYLAEIEKALVAANR